MSDNNAIALHDLLGDTEALQVSMERVMSGSTPDFAKWVTFKGMASQHQGIVKRYADLTGESASYYDSSKMSASGDTLWGTQKEIFESVYTLVVALRGKYLADCLTARQPVSMIYCIHR